MSWMNMLCQTYDNNISLAGKVGQEVTLSAIAHMKAKAQIEIRIDSTGNFVGANVVDKEAAEIIIPVTESSAGRASGIAPHALSDTLSYVAGDFANYVSDAKKKKLFGDKNKAYITQLKEWNSSEYTHPKVHAIYQYLQKACVISDLIHCQIINLDEDGNLAQTKIAGQPYEKALVRFVVLSTDTKTGKTWEDISLINAYTSHYLSFQKGKVDLCYISGKEKVITVNNPKGIVPSTYGAKLISANDKKNFTFRGRFLNSEEACTVSYEASQKAHLALTWLIAKQGNTFGTQDKRTYLCWNPQGKKVPKIEDEFSDYFNDEEEVTCDTQEEYRKKLWKTVNGYRNELEDCDNIVVISLDAATTGRLSVTYYNELMASSFLDKLYKWNEECCWKYTRFNVEKKPYQIVRTPTIKEIIFHSYGIEQGMFLSVNDKLFKEQSQRIYYCILDGHSIPLDMVRMVCNRASTPTAYKSRTNYENVLSTACALIKKYYSGRREIAMELSEFSEELMKDRNILFGRLLAVAENVERLALFKSAGDGNSIKRLTNATRLQAAFVNHPMRTWSSLEQALIPYYSKLGPGTTYFYKNLIGEIFANLSIDDAQILDRSLDEMYLIGYYAQRNDLLSSAKKIENK